MRKLLFIVNPNSGVGKQKVVEKAAEKYIDRSKYHYDFSYTEGPRHAIEISKNASQSYDVIAAVGGDGTVNEVSAGIIGSKSAMAIIPTGSGNGFARHMHIPCNVKSSLKLLNTGNPVTVDTAEINGDKFVNVSGIGFDADISHLFANYGKRGPLSYAQIITKEFKKYKPLTYQFYIDGEYFEKEAFLISFANSSQWGNNFFISPHASAQDGKIDVCVLKPFKQLEAAQVATSMVAKNIHKLKHMKVIQGKDIVVKNTFGTLHAHLDGEPFSYTEDLHISIKPSSLHVISSNSNGLFKHINKKHSKI